MPAPLKEGTNIYIEHKREKKGGGMNSMEMATDHYELGYVICGDRKSITPTCSYSYHAGDVSMSPPFVYHRTVAESEGPYERILIKYSFSFIKPFIENMGQQTFDELLEKRVSHFTKETQSKIESYLMEMLEEFHKDKPYKEFILQGMLFRLLAFIMEERMPDEGVVKSKTPLTPPIIDAITYIENFYGQDPSLKEAAQAANFSEAYFSRVFHEQLGMSYTEYLSNVKIRHVQILLIHTRKSIMEIAQETGYCHGNYLSEQFKKIVGMTPGEFRKNAGKH